MPVHPTFPGVYIEEIPSGVHTISGVSTSVTAFVGAAHRGPINRAVHILSFADYERAFGGLDADSEMSYAVRQFFANGGSDAWVVRVALNAGAATRPLQNRAAGGVDVLTLTARDEGQAGNDIQARVDYNTPNPAGTFNLTLAYAPADSPADARTETYPNLSMNSRDPRYVERVVNPASRLVQVQRPPGLDLSGLGPGTSASAPLVDGGGNLIDVATLRDNTHDQFQVAVNGLPAVTVQLSAADVSGGAGAAGHLDALRAAVQQKVRASASGVPALNNFTATIANGNTLVLTSGESGGANAERSSVRVLPGSRNDLAGRLRLGTINGGTETDAVAAVRPRVIPDAGQLTSGVFANADELNGLPSNAENRLSISIDGQGPDEITVSTNPTPIPDGDALDVKLGLVAAAIQAAVRALKPAQPAYRNFTASVAGGNQLQLTSGTQGTGSSVLVNDAAANSIAATLHLLGESTRTTPTNVMLQNGTGDPFTPDTAYGVFIGDRSTRQGLFALESVDLFNLLCLPGITDPGILSDADAYCKERRAFMIVDPPSGQVPDDMVTLIAGPALPKTDHAAVYYPWVGIADPLNGGQLRTSAPSGTMAGLYARTDSARGVWKAPAGTEATLTGVQAVEYALTDPQNGTLNPHGVNAIRLFPVFGPVAWGARTLRGDDAMADEWKYVPIRRLALFIEESLYRGTKWVVFEPNDEPLWAQIRLNVGAFMQNLFRQGAFQGRTPREAYFVKCDSETTTQNDIDLGIVNILVGFAPLKPAEFVIIQIQQMAGQIQV